MYEIFPLNLSLWFMCLNSYCGQCIHLFITTLRIYTSLTIEAVYRLISVIKSLNHNEVICMQINK